MKQLNIPWIIDPKNKQPSVSLTNFVASALLVITVVILQLCGKVKEPGIAMEYFAASAALYLGRKWSSKDGASLEQDPTSK